MLVVCSRLGVPVVKTPFGSWNFILLFPFYCSYLLLDSDCLQIFHADVFICQATFLFGGSVYFDPSTLR